MKDPVWVPCVVIKEFEEFTRIGTQGVCYTRDIPDKNGAYFYEFKYDKTLKGLPGMAGHIGDFANVEQTSYYFPKECLLVDCLSIRLSLL